MRYGIEYLHFLAIMSSYYEPEDTINVFNTNGFFKSEKCQIEDPFWREVKWCICDEVEKCINNTVEDVFLEMTNCERWYAFSATADKTKGEQITKDYKSDVISRNIKIVRYFGFSEVYHKPTLHRVDIYEIITKRFWNLPITAENMNQRVPKEEFDNKYSNWVEIYYDYQLMGLIHLICRAEGSMFIPLNRLQILDYWLENEFTEEDVILISSRGYQLYKQGKFEEQLELFEVKELIKDKKVRYVFGTSSAFQALDFEGIDNVMLLAYNTASIVLQAIGRVARQRHYKIFMLKSSNELPYITQDYDARLSLIKGYYNECNLNHYIKTDKEYDDFRY